MYHYSCSIVICNSSFSTSFCFIMLLREIQCSFTSSFFNLLNESIFIKNINLESYLLVSTHHG